MFSNDYNLNFSGYWLDASAGSMPTVSGVYCVYTCTYNSLLNQVSIKKLIYIGQAGNVQQRVSGHEKWADWKREICPGERLCFSTAAIGLFDDLDRAEAALIFWHKPNLNSEYVNRFPFQPTKITTSGSNALLSSQFSVLNQTQPPLPSLFRGLGRNF